MTGGTNNPGRPNGPNKQGLGWAYQILPFLEQNAVKNIVTQLDLQQQTIPGYYCPSRRSAEKVAGATGLTVLMDYAGVAPMTYRWISADATPTELLDITRLRRLQVWLRTTRPIGASGVARTAPEVNTPSRTASSSARRGN